MAQVMTFGPTSSCRKHSGSRRCWRDPCCPAQPLALRLRATYGWNPGCGSSENTLLSLESAEPGSPQKLFANIRGQSDFRLGTCDICNRLAHASVYRGCQKGVDVALMR